MTQPKKTIEEIINDRVPGLHLSQRQVLAEMFKAQRKEVERATMRSIRAALAYGNTAQKMIEVIDEKLQTLKD